MGKRRKWAIGLLAVILTLCSLLVGMAPVQALTISGAENNDSLSVTQALTVDARSAILVEASTGKVLFEINADQPFEPASMTKMMTEYLVMEAIKEGRIKWDQVATASDYVYFLGKNGGSRVFLAKGEKRTVRELFEAMAIYSGNDATVMLAELVAGSETNFVNLMNEKAKEFGMTNTHFVTSTGFPADQLGEYRPQIEGDHYMSAEDAAILGRRLILDHPEVTEFTSTPVAEFRKGEPGQVKMTNWNWLISTNKYAYQGADGLKTGHTDAAGWCLTATAERNGMRLISVVMGAPNEDKRFQETIKLFDFGFNNYELKQLVPSGSAIKGSEKVEVSKGKDTEVNIVTQTPYTTVIRRGEEGLYEATVTTDRDALKAPLEKGAVVGKLTYQYKGSEVYRYLTPKDEENAYVAMVTETEVEKAGWLRLFFRAILNFIADIFSQISRTVSGWFS